MANLSNEMQTYSFYATLKAADIPKLIFLLGNTESAKSTTVYFDHVVLEKIN